MNGPRYNNRQENNHRGWERDIYPQRWAFPIFHGNPLFVGQVGWRPEPPGGQTVGTCRPNCIDNCPGGSQCSNDVACPCD